MTSAISATAPSNASSSRGVSRFDGATIDDLDPAVAAAVREWRDTGMHRNVLLLGNVGVGKTYAAYVITQIALADDWFYAAEIIPVGELLYHLAPRADMAMFQRLASVPLLVLDDLGTQPPTDWWTTQVYGVLNRRWVSRLPTIATSNHDIGPLAKAIGDRAYSRLADDAIVLRMPGKDRRKSTR